MMDKNRIARMSNEDVVRFFVSCVGADYKTDYTPHLWPDFSADTTALWDEIEARMTERKTLSFDRDECRERLREKIRTQVAILNGGPDYSTSYHYGIKSGLETAFGIVEDCITGGDGYAQG
jgi:hypothetical protein